MATSMGFSAMWPISVTLDRTLIEYIDLLYQIMGVDISFESWKLMTEGEKLQLIRDIKLKKLIEEWKIKQY